MVLFLGNPLPIECTSVVAPPISMTTTLFSSSESDKFFEKISAALITAVGVGIIISPMSF